MINCKVFWVMAVPLLLLLAMPLFAGTVQIASTAGLQADNDNEQPTRPNTANGAGALAVSFSNQINGGTRLITFDTDPLGYQATLNLGSGVSLQCLNCNSGGLVASGVRQELVAGGSFAPNLIGYNTTTTDPIGGTPGNPGNGGSTAVTNGQFYRFTPLFSSSTDSCMSGATCHGVAFSFTTGISAFGTFITGLQGTNGSLRLYFSDGSSQYMPDQFFGSSTGGVHFVAITSNTTAITRIEFTFTSSVNDAIGFDDLRYANFASNFGSLDAPEPSTYMTFAGGLLALLLLRRNRPSV